MSGTRDAIVVGGGHNGLVCGAYLARAGLAVTVLEAHRSVGGCAATVDALDGARVNVCNCDHSFVLSTGIVEELDLARFGLRYLPVDPVQVSMGWDGWTPWFQFRDPARTIEGLRVTHPGEAENYRRYLRAAMPVARLILELAAAPPTPGGIARRLTEQRGRGVGTLLAWSRRSVASVVSSFFSTESLRAPVVATGPAVWGLPPGARRTGLGALGYAVKHLTGVARPEGGSGELPAALARCIEDSGGEVRTRAPVIEILAEGSRVRGVRLEGGETVDAPVVVAAADPRTALVRWLASPPAAAQSLVRRWRSRTPRQGYESKVDAVVALRPRLRALDDGLLARLGVSEPLIPTVIVSPSLDGIARAHRAMARGEVAERPICYVNVPSVLDGSMRVGDEDLFSLEVLFTPYRLRVGWDRTDEPARWLGAFSTLCEPGFRDGVRRWRAVTPPDYEREFGLERGLAPAFSGTPLSVLVGRDRELTRYETPVRGLFLTGAGTFPGAGVWGASGRNAAAVILRRLGG
ncbi:MAG: phytoene desaturase family protein [Actinomycetota bacterium]